MIAVIFGLSALFGCNALLLKNGAYEGLVLQVEDDVPFEKCREVLANLETTVISSSQYLFSALDGRAYIRSATILLPNSWPRECEPHSPVSSKGEGSDVFITTRGQPAWTLQTRGCGQQGDAIYVNRESLLKLSSDEDETPLLARQFIREFAKYRYGVFDEHGYGNDEIYPTCYHDGDLGSRAKVTGCSDLSVQDNGMCSNTNADFNSTLASIDPLARTSIMFDVSSRSVSMFCDEGNHDRYAPTKHNFICDRRSTLDVILQHKDFLTSDHRPQFDDGQQITNTTPVINYARKRLTRYVLVVEDTQDMFMRESWTYLRNAIRKWAIHDLKSNTELSLVTINDTAATVLLQPTLLQNHTARDVVASNVPYTSGDARGPPCIKCAIKDAITLLNTSTIERGPANNIIVIVAPGMDASIANKVTKNAEDANVKITTINYPGVKAGRTPLDVLSDVSGGQAYTVYERKHNVDTSLLTTYFELTNVFVDIATKNYEGPITDMPIEIHRRELTDDGRTSVTGSFVLDENLSEPARFALYTHNTESPLIRTVSLWSPSQKIYARRSDSLLGLKIITLSAQINEPGTWTYRIERWTGNPQPHYVQVTATPKRPIGPIVRAELKVARPKPGLGPKALYVKVMSGTHPVMGARVDVLVSRVEINGTVGFSDRFELKDVGGGDPDVTKGDGIYTRYWSPSSAAGPGIYTFEVSVTDNGNTAYAAIPEGHGSEGACCGSSIPLALKVKPLQPFQRSLPPLTLHYTQEDLDNELKVPSGRIGDLKARVLTPEKRVRLSWTSPDMGGRGTVTKYEVRYARTLQDISDRYETSSDLWEVGTPFLLAPGAETTFTLNFSTPLLGQVFYFAIKAYGPSESQEPLISNWVRIFVPKPTPPTLPTGVPTTSGSSWPNYESAPVPEGGFSYEGNDGVVPAITQSPDFNTTWARLGVPVAVGLVLLLLLVTVYCYYCVAKKRGRDNAKKPVNPSNGTKGDKLQSSITIVPSSPSITATPIAQPHMDNNHYNTQHAYTNELQLQQHLDGDIGVPAYQYDDEPKKRYSIIQQPNEQQLIEELKQQQQQYGVAIISSEGRTLSPYESWSASQLLHEHEMRRHSPQDEQMHHHMQQGQVDHYGVLIPPPVPPLPAYGSQNVYGTTMYGPQPVLPAYHPQPPPQFNVSLQGSMSSVNSAEKKRRNVTMV